MKDEFQKNLENLKDEDRIVARKKSGYCSKLDFDYVNHQMIDAIMSVAEVVMVMDGHTEESKARLNQMTRSIKDLIKAVAFTHDAIEIEDRINKLTDGSDG